MAGGHSCPNPACANPSIEDIDDKRICVSCGTVLHESSIVSEITFGETSSGAAVVQGSYIGADQSHARSSGPFRNRKQSSEESREQTLASGKLLFPSSLIKNKNKNKKKIKKYFLTIFLVNRYSETDVY